MNIILCGLPMSGKTTIGKLLAEALQFTFIDTDLLIESQFENSLSCRQIFQKVGEKSFRALEEEVIASLIGVSSTVIAIGGGALTRLKNRSTLDSIGKIVYLKASPAILWKRIQQQGIPAYLDAINPEHSFYSLAKNRLNDYEQAAIITVDTSSLNERGIVTELLKILSK